MVSVLRVKKASLSLLTKVRAQAGKVSMLSRAPATLMSTDTVVSLFKTWEPVLAVFLELSLQHRTRCL